MVNGKIAFSMGSTVPTLERSELVLPRKEEEVIDTKPDLLAISATAPAPTALPALAVEGSNVTTEQVPEQDIMAVASAPAQESETPSVPIAIDVEANDTVVVKTEPVDLVDNPSESIIIVPAPNEETQGSKDVQEAHEDSEIVHSKPPRDLTQRTTRSALPLPASLFIGDLRLTLLRTRLQSLTPPIPVEFAGSGILICGPGVLALSNGGQSEQGKEVVKAGSIVAVRKGEKGVVVEGGVGVVYDLVRKEVYGSFAQVSAA